MVKKSFLNEEVKEDLLKVFDTLPVPMGAILFPTTYNTADDEEDVKF